MTKQPDTFATRLAAAMQDAGLSTQAIAERAGLSRQSVYQLLQGQREPTWDTVQRLAKALEVSTEQLRTDRL